MPILEFTNEDGSELIAEVEITDEEQKAFESLAEEKGISFEKAVLEAVRMGMELTKSRIENQK